MIGPPFLVDGVDDDDGGGWWLLLEAAEDGRELFLAEGISFIDFIIIICW